MSVTSLSKYNLITLTDLTLRESELFLKKKKKFKCVNMSSQMLEYQAKYFFSF